MKKMRMMKPIYISPLLILSVFSAKAENFVWNFSFNNEQTYFDNASSANSGDMVGVKNATYTYNFNTKTMEFYYALIRTNGAGIEDPSWGAEDTEQYTDIYLNNIEHSRDSNVEISPDTITMLNEEVSNNSIKNIILASWKQQAVEDVTDIQNNLVSNFNNILLSESNKLSDYIVDEIFNGANITSTDIIYNLSSKLSALSNRTEKEYTVSNILINLHNIDSNKIHSVKNYLNTLLLTDVPAYNRALGDMAPNTGIVSQEIARVNHSMISNQILNRMDNITLENKENNGGFWIDGSYNNTKKSGGIEFNGNTYGFMVGLDKKIGSDLLLGLGYSYNNSRVTTENEDTVTDISSNILTVYGRYKSTQWYLDGSISVDFASLKDSNYLVNSSHNSFNIGTNLLTGYDLESGLGFQTGVRYLQIHEDSYTDSMNQNIDSKNNSILTVLFDVKYISPLNGIFSQKLHIGALYDLYNEDNVVDVNLLGSKYQLRDKKIEPFGGVAGIAFDFNISNWNFELGYDIEYRDDLVVNSGKLRVKHNF